MNKEEKDLIEEMIDQLKEYASGGASGLYPFEESVKALLDYINQLEEDKKDLLFKKELLKSEIYEDTTSMDKVEKEFNVGHTPVPCGRRVDSVPNPIIVTRLVLNQFRE